MKNWIALILAIGLLGSIVGWGLVLSPPSSPVLPAQATATVQPTYTRPPLPTNTPVPRPTGGPTATLPAAPSTTPAGPVSQPTPLPPALPGTGVDGALPYLAMVLAAALAAVAAGIGLRRRWGRG